MTIESEKKLAAEAALDYIGDHTLLGVGSGSTVAYFIQALSRIRHKIEAAVASSKTTARLLIEAGIPVVDLNPVEVHLYVDGADEIDDSFRMIKGGGGAHTCEKIIATAAHRFICIADSRKKVAVLGQSFPVPVEVIPMARSLVARQIAKMGAQPLWREGFVSDQGNWVLDVHHLALVDPASMETRLKNIVGVVETGIFAHRKADVLLLAEGNQVKVSTRF